MNLKEQNFLRFFNNLFYSLILFDSKSLRTFIRFTSRQIYFTGVQALWFVFCLSIFLGFITIFEVASVSERFGTSGLLGKILHVVIVRELGPLIIALIVIGRSGTAIATELGNMKISGEVRSLELLGINPFTFIVLPRLFGVVVSTIVLSLIFSTISIIGGLFVSKLLTDISIRLLADEVLSSISLSDVVLNVIKSFFFGITISLVSSFNGFTVMESPTEVPRVTTKSVVSELVICFLFNLIVTFFTYKQILNVF